jgi:hypothetical protein
MLTTNQNIFVSGRYILESVVSAHEIIHEAIKNEEKRIVLKLDYEKHMIELVGNFLKKC